MPEPEWRSLHTLCPYGQPGERLWVRETHAHIYKGNVTPATRRHDDVAYKADGFAVDEYVYGPWKPSIHMLRWASRITLKVTGVRVERLGDLSESDARAEGVQSVAEFKELWASINGPGSWAANPWVWAVSFKRLAADASCRRSRLCCSAARGRRRRRNRLVRC
jgi:hypothetical protein